jgi:preprotein translocase subunit SecG
LEQGAEKNIWTLERGSKRKLEKITWWETQFFLYVSLGVKAINLTRAGT